jgi:thioredoxin reductase (NADPH)
MGTEAVAEANFLAGIGVKVVFLARKEPRGLDAGITVRVGTVTAIRGDALGVTELVFRPSKTSGEESLACGGVFILRPSIAPGALIAGIEVVDGHIAVDETRSTNKAGVFAAGDCVGKPLQVAKAVGDGQRACFGAVSYLDRAAAPEGS